MKTKSTFAEILMIALLLVPFAYVALIWSQLPPAIATHYDMRGNANGWMDKETSVWIVALLAVFIYVVLRFLPRIDPRKMPQSTNYQKLRFIVTLFFAGVMTWMWHMAGHPTETMHLMGPLFALCGLLLAGLGNYMTTVKPNWFVGIRTPWTLQNDVVWRRTHQLGGRLMVAGGLLSAVLALVVPMPYVVGVVIGIILLVSLISIGYSYIYFQQEKAR